MSTTIVDALGWTLLHSLWQGAVIALLLGITLRAMKHFQARARYLTAGGAFMILFLCAGLTLANRMTTSPDAVGSFFGLSVTAVGFSQPLITFLAEQMNLLVVFWITGVAVFGIRFAGGYGYTRRLSRRHSRMMSDAWQQRINKLAAQLGIRRSIALAESALVQVPMVIGHLKPIVILPLGLLSHLSRQELEAVLLHELGHVARADYLFNMLQSLVEVLFFYHPAVWWMTKLMRAEREHCCDDLAIAVTRDPVTFAKALARLADLELSGTRPQLAMAASGNGSLMFRIRRLVERDRLPGFTERLAAAVLVFCGLFTVGFLSAAPTQKSGEGVMMEIVAQFDSEFGYTIETSAEALPAALLEEERRAEELARSVLDNERRFEEVMAMELEAQQRQLEVLSQQLQEDVIVLEARIHEMRILTHARQMEAREIARLHAERRREMSLRERERALRERTERQMRTSMRGAVAEARAE